MILFLAALVLLGALAALRAEAGTGGGPPLRRGLVVLVALLPAVYAAVLLVASGERIGQLRFDYVGKRLAFEPGLPITAGGSSPESEDYEDLHDGVLEGLPPRVVELRRAPAEPEGGGAGGRRGELFLHLRSPSPVVVVAGSGEEPRTLNSYSLADGDRLVLAAGDTPLELHFEKGFLWRDDALLLGDERYALQAGRVVYLPDALGELDVDAEAAQAYRSALIERDGAWTLLLREDTVHVVGEDGDTRRFVHDHPVRGPRLSIALQVVWTSSDGWILKTLRDDTILVGEGDQAEIRFGDRRRLAVDPLPPGRDRLTIAVAVPGSLEEQAILELDDASPRFRGVSALFEMGRGGTATLTHLGRREPLEFGRVYGLGEGRDRILLRVGHEDMPWYLVLDLVLLGLFFLVFLGRGMVVDGALTAVVGAAGMLLANRLLFAYRAAERPPGFEVRVLTETRMALWLVAALILGLYALAWIVARDPGEAPRFREVVWPLAGLGLSALAVGLVGGGPVLLVPLALAAVVVAAVALGRGAGVRARLARWRSAGVPWGWKVPALVGAALLLVRAFAAAFGMPEALRFLGQRLLWTVIQIPLSVVVVALSLELLRRYQAEEGWPARRFAFGVLSLLAFLALAFGAVAFLVRDAGLLLAQALPYALALMALVVLPRGRMPTASGVGEAVLRAVALLLLLLPIVGVLWMNVVPEHTLAAVAKAREVKAAVAGIFEGGMEDEATLRQDSDAVGSRAPSHRMLRLYMLSDPEVLPELGLVASERMAIHYGTLQSYAQTGGWGGAGYLAADLPRYLGETYLSDLVPMVFVLPEEGKLGLVGLALLYLAPLLGLALFAAPPEDAGPRDRRSPLARQALWLAGVALLALAVPSLFMLLGNLNLALFTGKNCALLGLNSLSDAVESGALLGLAALGVSLRALPASAAVSGSERRSS